MKKTASANPFTQQTMIQEAELFIGRRAEFDQLSQLLRSMQNVSLVGARRIGKSSLLYHLYRTGCSTAILKRRSKLAGALFSVSMKMSFTLVFYQFSRRFRRISSLNPSRILFCGSFLARRCAKQLPQILSGSTANGVLNDRRFAWAVCPTAQETGVIRQIM